MLRPPGDFDVDICVGEGQTLGNRLDFGGPCFGFFAAQNAYLRRMPGRIAGETTDVDGRRGFVLTLQTREQHIRREKATHNICTAQALNALAGMIYLSWLGRDGIVELGELLVSRTHYARETLTALDGVTALHDQPVVREFALKLDADVLDVIECCAERGVNPGYPLPDNGLLVAITEQRSKADIDRLAEVLEGGAGGMSSITENRLHADPGIEGHDPHPRRSALVETDMQRDRAKTIYEKSKTGRRAFVAPELDVPKHELPSQFRRAEPPKLPEIAEPEIVRHYNRLSKRNFDLDTGFYPLGSCTMKHNPKLHERVAALPGNARLHPLQNPKRAQGALQLMHELQGALGEVAGLPHVVAAAVRRLARRARRRPAHPRLPRGPRRQAHEDPHARHRARHQPGDGDDGRLRGRQGRHRRARRRRRRRPARQGRRATSRA